MLSQLRQAGSKCTTNQSGCSECLAHGLSGARAKGVCCFGDLAMGASTGGRRYPRMKSPKGLSVAWQTATRRLVSFVDMLGLGGLFIRTKEPPAIGTIIQLLIDIPGGGVRARAIVRDIKSGEGMGVGIVSMGQEDRLRLSSFLSQLPP
jgi:PilZ domain